MLTSRRTETDLRIETYVNGVEKLRATASQVSGLEEALKVKAVEVEEKKAQAEAMIPTLEAEKSKANDESREANKVYPNPNPNPDPDPDPDPDPNPNQVAPAPASKMLEAGRRLEKLGRGGGSAPAATVAPTRARPTPAP